MNRFRFIESPLTLATRTTHTFATNFRPCARPRYALFPAKICFKSHLDKSHVVEEEMRNAGRLKLGYYPLPVEEAQNIRALLMSSAPYAAIDPCVGDGTALLEITRDTKVHLAGIELDTDRTAAAGQKGIATVHGSSFECRVLTETCSLLYLNPPYDTEF